MYGYNAKPSHFVYEGSTLLMPCIDTLHGHGNFATFLVPLYSHIILMLADDMACNPRNAYPGEHSWGGCGCVLAPPFSSHCSKSVQQLQKEPQRLW